MTIQDLKITEEDFSGKNIQSITENTVIGQAEALKRLFDAPAQEVLREKINEILDFFKTTSAGKEIGTPAINANSGETVAEQLIYLFQTIQELSAGIVPDGSVTDEKLSNAAGQLKQTVAELEAGRITTDSPAFTGTPTVPTASAEDSSEQIANTAFVQNLFGAHTGDQIVHLSSAERAKWNAKFKETDFTAEGCDLASLAGGDEVCGIYRTGENTAGTPYQDNMTTQPEAAVIAYYAQTSNCGAQLAIVAGDEVYLRTYAEEWTGWQKICTTGNTVLDTIGYMNQCTDPDTITESGFYYMTASTTNAPTTSGYMLAAFMANGRGTQIAAVNGTSSNFWIRSNMTGSGGGWQTWRKIVTTDMFSYSGGTLTITM